MSSSEPERFITVSELELIVDGRPLSVSRSGGGRLGLTSPAAVPAGEHRYRHRLFSDDGELISDRTRPVRILHGSDEPRSEYAVEFTSVAEPVG